MNAGIIVDVFHGERDLTAVGRPGDGLEAGGEVVLEDTSKYGTFLNGERVVGRVVVSPGDRVVDVDGGEVGRVTGGPAAADRRIELDVAYLGQLQADQPSTLQLATQLAGGLARLWRSVGKENQRRRFHSGF